MRCQLRVVLASLTVAIAAAASEGNAFTGDGTTYNLGRTDAGHCNMMQGIAASETHYAALNNEQWSNTQQCGRCAEVRCVDQRCADHDKTEIVQILDRCPECKHGDLDLSPSVFSSLTGHNTDRFKIHWRFVDCPVQGNVEFCLKSGANEYWTAVQPSNVVSGVTSLKINGQEAKLLGSAYYYLIDGGGEKVADLGSVQLTMTSVNGEKMEDTLSLSAGKCTPGKSQFARGGGGGGGGDSPTPGPTPRPVPTATTTAPPSPPKPTTQSPTPYPTETPAPTTTEPVPTVHPPEEPTKAPTPAPSPTQEPEPTTSRPTLKPTQTPFPVQSPTPAPVPTPTKKKCNVKRRRRTLRA